MIGDRFGCKRRLRVRVGLLGFGSTWFGVVLSFFLLGLVACSVRFVLGAVRFGSVRFASLRIGSARLGSARLGSAQFGSVQFSSARSGPVRSGSVQFGSIRFSSVRFDLPSIMFAIFGSKPASPVTW